MKKMYTLCIALSFVFIAQSSFGQTQVTFYTTMGDFVVELYDSLTPITSGNFISLVNDKFYDSLIFHRVIDDFVIQGGDPLGTGYGGPGYTIEDEFVDELSNVQKTIAMANTGAPNSAGSQFYINLVDNVYLDGGYAVFGIVIENFSVVQDIGAVPTDALDKPLTDVVMDSLRVTYDPFAVGIQQSNNQLFHIAVSSNPATEESFISIYTESGTEASISVYDPQGRKIYGGQKNLVSGVNIISCKEIQLADLAHGIYHFVVSNGESIAQVKIVTIQ